MQENDRARYTDAELVALVQSMVSDTSDSKRTELGNSREVARDFYLGMRPYAIVGNTSDYVSMEVLDSVETLKSRMLRTFRSNRNVVRFKPTSEQDVENAKLRTTYVNELFDNRGGSREQAQAGRGRGYKLLNDIFHNGFLYRLACIKRGFVETSSVVSEQFDQVPVEQLQALAQREDVERIEVESEEDVQQQVPTQMGPVEQTQRVASGTVLLRKKSSEIILDCIAPENVFIPSRCTDLMDLDEVAIRYDKTKYQLIREGFDPEQVNKLHSGSSTVTNRRRGVSDDGNKERSTIEVYEAYVQIDMTSPPGEPPVNTTLYQLVVAGNQLLLADPVKEIPLRFWTPIMLANEAIGLSIADVTIDLQSTISNTVRGIEDNVHRTNAGVRMANLDVIRNPADLIDNPIGGIIDTPDMSAVQIVPQPPVSGATGMLLEMLTTQKEMRTGDTRLGKGLESQNVITHQNSGDMIAQLINVGNERPLQMARGFAETCLVPLMQDLYRIGFENGHVVTMDVKGTYQPFDPRAIPFADAMEVDVALTPEYGEQRAAQLMSIHSALKQEPAIGPLYTMPEQYAVLSEVFHLMGMPNWLADPTDPQVGQRMQQAQQAVAAQQAEAKQLQMLGIQLEERKVRVLEQNAGITAQQAEKTAQSRKEALDLDAAKSASELSLDERKFQWDRMVDAAELKLEAQQRRAVALGGGGKG